MVTARGAMPTRSNHHVSSSRFVPQDLAAGRQRNRKALRHRSRSRNDAAIDPRRRYRGLQWAWIVVARALNAEIQGKIRRAIACIRFLAGNNRPMNAGALWNEPRLGCR